VLAVVESRGHGVLHSAASCCGQQCFPGLWAPPADPPPRHALAHRYRRLLGESGSSGLPVRAGRSARSRAPLVAGAMSQRDRGGGWEENTKVRTAVKASQDPASGTVHRREHVSMCRSPNPRGGGAHQLA